MLFLLAGIVTIGGAWTAMRAWAATPPATTSVTDRQTSYRRLGVGVASRELFDAGVYSSAGHLIGSEAGICTYLGSKARICHMVFTLPRGQIVVEGALSSRLLYELAIVGATELYDNARGTLTSTSLGLRPRRDVLIFRLAG